MFSTAPDRPNCVDYELSRQSIAARNPRFTCSATSEHAAFGKQLRACAAMNRAIYAAAAEECRISCVYNGINIELRDIAAENFDFRTHIKFCRVGVASAKRNWSGGV